MRLHFSHPVADEFVMIQRVEGLPSNRRRLSELYDLCGTIYTSGSLRHTTQCRQRGSDLQSSLHDRTMTSVFQEVRTIHDSRAEVFGNRLPDRVGSRCRG